KGLAGGGEIDDFAACAEGGVQRIVGVVARQGRAVKLVCYARRDDLAVGLEHDAVDGVIRHRRSEPGRHLAAYSEGRLQRAIGQVACQRELRILGDRGGAPLTILPSLCMTTLYAKSSPRWKSVLTVPFLPKLVSRLPLTFRRARKKLAPVFPGPP